MSFSIEDKAAHNLKMKRLIKSQEKNPLFKKKAKDSKPDVKPSAKALKKLNKESSKTDTKENDETLAEYAGTTSEKGSRYKTRPQWKLREDNASHTKTVRAQKKIIRKQKELKEIRKEKRQIDRPKMKKRNPKDIDNSIVNKYLKLLHSRDDSHSKPKKSKWYTE